jgi:hypothetical protein
MYNINHRGGGYDDQRGDQRGRWNGNNNNRDRGDTRRERSHVVVPDRSNSSSSNHNKNHHHHHHRNDWREAQGQQRANPNTCNSNIAAQQGEQQQQQLEAAPIVSRKKQKCQEVGQTVAATTAAVAAMVSDALPLDQQQQQQQGTTSTQNNNTQRDLRVAKKLAIESESDFYKKVVLLLPENEKRNAERLHMNPDSYQDFAQRCKVAEDKTMKWLLDDYNNKKNSKKTNKNAGGDDDDDEYDDDDDIITEPINFNPFIRALSHNALLHAGFHAVALSAGLDEWCYCPCSRKAAVWRNVFGLNKYLDHGPDCCEKKSSSKGAYTAKGLLDHLSAVCKMNNGNAILHEITFHYLEVYFDNFRGGLMHMAFYGLNDANVRRKEGI